MRSSATTPPVEGGESCANPTLGVDASIRAARKTPPHNCGLQFLGGLSRDDDASQPFRAWLFRVAEGAAVAFGVEQNRRADEIELAGTNALLYRLGAHGSCYSYAGRPHVLGDVGGGQSFPRR